MSAATKNKKSTATKKASKQSPVRVYNDRVSDEVGNYEKHPFFVKKANKMKELLDRVGWPERLTAKAK